MKAITTLQETQWGKQCNITGEFNGRVSAAERTQFHYNY